MSKEYFYDKSTQSLTDLYEVTYDYDEFDDGEIVEQVIVDGEKYIDIEYYAKRVADLQTKVKKLTNIKNYQTKKLLNKNAKLKKQLAEKEKEIERLLIAKELLFSDLHYARMDCEKTNRQIRELDKSCGGIINNLTTQIEQANQDKISFAVEQLEKVKEFLLIESKEHPIVYDISDDVVGGAIDRDKCFSIIDNQIKTIKEMK